ncbi:PQQ-binding-like beta-propeller repeat protein [Natrinema soli]|uniref:PQQ-binding-like beta-propeller repeat protein n=1 Tax=Natrinema soli TaxID=1930624 RepID=A0ABD5SSM1_9EURY|nr:PQQ-binding-like beta-propeller repeat protein [Natrinema soli]
MADWNRRSVLSTGIALSTSGLLASFGTAAAQSTDEQPMVQEAVEWSSHGGTPGNTRYIPSSDDFEQLETVAWQYDGAGNVVVNDGTVYLQTAEEVHAIDADDGTTLWTSTDGYADRAPAVAHNTVYVTGEELTAIDAESGSVDWRTPLGSDALVSAPLVVFETVYVIVDGVLRAFDAANGSLRWEHESITVTSRADDDPIEASYVCNPKTTAIAASADTLWALLDKRRSEVTIDADGIVALDPLTGSIRLAEHLDPGNYADSLMVTEDTIYLGQTSNEQTLECDPSTAEPTPHSSNTLTPAVNETQVVTQGRHGLESSGENASWEKDGTYSYGPPTIVGDTVIVAYSVHGSSTSDEVVAFDLNDGSEKWRFTFDETQWRDALDVECIVDGDVVYVCRGDELTAICPAR